MHLTLDDMRIDGAADIVRRDDFEQPDLAGFFVYLDNSGLRGIRIRRGNSGILSPRCFGTLKSPMAKHGSDA
mgnify:CR=1 FL=1